MRAEACFQEGKQGGVMIETPKRSGFLYDTIRWLLCWFSRRDIEKTLDEAAGHNQAAKERTLAARDRLRNDSTRN